ncbi:hypothetical protein [Promicromonospora soli]
MTLDRPDFDMTVAHAAEHGTRRDLLVAMRRRLAAALEDDRTQPRDLSPIVIRLRELSAEIDEIDTRGTDGLTDAAATPDAPFEGTDL